MLQDELSRDAIRLLCLMYKTYLEQVNAGQPKARAKQFGSLQSICTTFLPEEHPADVAETCAELGRSGYLSNLYASNKIIRSSLTDKAIVAMENRFRNNVRDVASFLSQFIP